MLLTPQTSPCLKAVRESFMYRYVEFVQCYVSKHSTYSFRGSEQVARTVFVILDRFARETDPGCTYSQKLYEHCTLATCSDPQNLY